MFDVLLAPNNDFQTFGLQHGLTLVFSAIVGILLIRLGRRSDQATKDRIGRIIGLSIICAMFLWIGIRLVQGTFDHRIDLPLALCRVMGLLAPVLAYTKSYRLFEVLYFWILAGTLQALITPDLDPGFPHLKCMKFWVVHSGLVILILYFVMVQGYRPTWKSMWRAFGWLQVAFLLTIVLNYLLDANYNFLNSKPESASVLDHLGAWPYYILFVQLLIIPLFALVYLPIHFSRRRAKG